MAKAMYIGVDNVARKVKKLYIGVDGVARKVKKGYIGVNGVARLFYSSGLPLSSLPHGALVRINENSSPVPFYLAKHDYESGLNGSGRTLMVRKDSYGKQAWHRSASFTKYANSAMNTHLTTTYFALLDSAVQSAIGTTKFYYTSSADTTSVGTLSRSVFLLSATEFGGVDTSPTGMYTFNVEGSTLPIASLLAVDYQWTRSPRTGASQPIYVTVGGKVGSNGSQSAQNHRPAFTLPSTLLVDPEPNADGSYTLLV